MRTIPLMLTSFLAFSAACTGTEPAPDGLVTTRDSVGGVLHIIHAGDPPAWTPELTASIGTLEDGPASLARIRALLLGRTGEVFVADAGHKVVREFGPDGSYRRDIGREGAGPAEYREPYSLAWVGDTLAVLDPLNVRVGLFGLDGAWRGQWASPPLTGGSQVRLYPSGDGAVYLIGLREVAGRLTREFLGYRPSGVLDTMPDLPRGLAGGGVDCQRPRDGALVFFDVPFAPRQLHIPGPGGTFYLVESNAYRIIQLTPSGDTVRVIARMVPTVPITDAEWEDGTRDFREAKEKDPDMICGVGSLPRAAVKPAVHSIFLADDGTLWVDRWVAEGKVTEVFGADGTLLGAFPTPVRNEEVIPSARGRRLAVAAVDAEGVPVVRLYTLR